MRFRVLLVPVTLLFFLFAGCAALGTKEPAPPTATRDAATVLIKGEVMPAPLFGMLIAGQGSSGITFHANPLIACDKFASKDFKGSGTFALAGTGPGKTLYVCSYSISNGNSPQKVQFFSGWQASAGGDYTCGGTPASGEFHLTANQFVSQGSGIGAVLAAGEGLCVKTSGEVSVNISYASF